jgi:hypothetical protein
MWHSPSNARIVETAFLSFKFAHRIQRSQLCEPAEALSLRAKILCVCKGSGLVVRCFVNRAQRGCLSEAVKTPWPKTRRGAEPPR